MLYGMGCGRSTIRLYFHLCPKVTKCHGYDLLDLTDKVEDRKVAASIRDGNPALVDAFDPDSPGDCATSSARYPCVVP